MGLLKIRLRFKKKDDEKESLDDFSTMTLKNGRNLALYNSARGFIDFVLLKSHRGEINRFCLMLCFPLRTYLILQALFEENEFFSDPENNNIDVKYKEFITDKSNVTKLGRLQNNEFSKAPSSCHICQEDFAARDAVYILPTCCHFYHPTCIELWFCGSNRPKQRCTCPACSVDLTYYIKTRLQGMYSVRKTLKKFRKVDRLEYEFWNLVVKKEKAITEKLKGSKN